MHFPSPLIPRPHETFLKFGLIWSAAGSFLALSVLAGCAYFIPQSTNAPRYNSVEGERRAPQLNNVSSAPRTDPRSISNPSFQPQSSVPAQPVTPVAPVVKEPPFVENTNPPLRSEPPAPTPVAETYSWWNPMGWFVEDVPPAATSARKVPPQNGAMEAQGYPQLQDTPTSPFTPAQTDQLNATRSDLEAERTAADRRASQLATDAAAEPSLLAPQPAVPPVPSVVRPEPSTGDASIAATPKVVNPAPQGYSIPALESSVLAQEPIQLRPPKGAGVPATTSGGQSASASAMNPTTSGFDPMSGAEMAPVAKPPSGLYPGSGYLPPSRYGAGQSY